MNKKLLITTLALVALVVMQPAQAVSKKQIAGWVAGATLVGTAGYWLYSHYTAAPLEEKQPIDFTTLEQRRAARNQKIKEKEQQQKIKAAIQAENEQKRKEIAQAKSRQRQQPGSRFTASETPLITENNPTVQVMSPTVQITNEQPTVKTTPGKKRTGKRGSRFDTFAHAFPKENKQVAPKVETVTPVDQTTNTTTAKTEPKKPIGGFKIFDVGLARTNQKQTETTKLKSKKAELTDSQKAEAAQIVVQIKAVIDSAKNPFQGQDKIKNILQQLKTVTNKDILAYNNQELLSYAKQANKENYIKF